MKPAPVSEQELIRGCIDCQPKYQALLYSQYSGKMFAVCLRYASDYHSAEDILQEAFVKAFRNIARFRGEGSFEGWLRRIFVNTAIEHYRKKVQMYPIVEYNQVQTDAVPTNALDNLMADDLMAMLQELSAGYRTIFNLYVIEGYSHKEISEMLHITEGTSKSQLARARYLLQRKLQELNLKSEESYV